MSPRGLQLSGGFKYKVMTFQKGHIPCNKGKKGLQVAWNKGTKGILKPNKTSFKKGQIPWNAGKRGLQKHTKEWKKKARLRLKREWRLGLRKGHITTEETKKKLRIASIKAGCKPPIKRGKDSYLWKGGITPLVEKIRRCLKYCQWRSAVFARDNFTCQLCEARSGNGKAVYLEADHYPKNFSDIFYKNKIKTFEEALNCEEFWNINNGRTLCRDCHNKTKPGRGKKRQLELSTVDF